MISPAVESACAFAWRNYLLLHRGVRENDGRRDAMYRCISSLCETGEYDFDLLQIAAVAYLKKLDELQEDRDARRAADHAVAKYLESRSAQADSSATRADQKGANRMTDKTPDANRVALEQQKRFTSAAAIGLNALKPMMHFQASMLRLAAQNIEICEEGVERAVEEQSKQERAA